MVTFTALWLPILLSAVVVHFAGFVMWMVMPHHKSDWTGLADEDGVLEALRRAGVGRGQYMFPYCADPQQMSSPEMAAKYAKGPVGQLVVWPSGKPAIGKNLVFYLIYTLAISSLCAYVAMHALLPGAEYLRVFQIVGTVAWLAYAGALAPLAIWFGRSWSSVSKEIFDGLVFALLTAGIFGWRWPG